jgi:dipeptidyl aminopeptidase/acylaminoacyl peptidase
MVRATLFCACVLLLGGPAAAADKRPMKVDDLFRFQRVSDPQVSPDGKSVAYVVASVDLAANKIASSIWLAPTGKGAPRQLTNSGGKKDSHPRWSPDGKRLLFQSNRSGSSQLWSIDLGGGGEARQLTTISTGASTGLWSRDGKSIAFVSAVFPEFSDKPFKKSDALNKKKQEESDANPVKARVFTKLFFRHWDSYVEDKRQHLFVLPFADGKAGEPKDVTPGDRDAYPTSDTFSVGDDFTFSPDGKYLLYTAPPARDEAWSTNYDIWRVPVTGGKAECLTKANEAADGAPRFSPDGKKLAYRAQKRAGFEADKWDILVVDVDDGGAFKGKPKSVTSGVDLSVDEFIWATVWGRRGAGPGLVFAADDQGSRPLHAVAPNGDVFLTSDTAGTHGSLSTSADGKRIAFTVSKLTAPAEVYLDTFAQAKGKEAVQLSHANDKLLAELDLPRPESVKVKVEGAEMQMWVLKPPGFDPKKKWPVAYLVHGGPQGAWEDGWSYRWCPELWAAQGYVVALPNPRGSTGFGQKYVDEISGDWGGKCYRDLMKGVDYLETLPYVDKSRVAAAGASFGGYMMNWFAVNTGRFKCLITHCSVWNFESMYATTDELWFDEWEHGGPPWGPNRKSYEQHSPHRRAANLGKFKTPMLIIHNDNDFRCPIGQGHELFSSLQRQRVPSRFINFPDEGHWVLKPKNSAYWHKEVFAWLTKYVPPGGK